MTIYRPTVAQEMGGDHSINKALISVSLLLAAIGALGNLCWALAGHLFQRLFLLYGRQLNWMLAALLVYCAVRIVVE